MTASGLVVTTVSSLTTIWMGSTSVVESTNHITSAAHRDVEVYVATSVSIVLLVFFICSVWLAFCCRKQKYFQLFGEADERGGVGQVGRHRVLSSPDRGRGGRQEAAAVGRTADVDIRRAASVPIGLGADRPASAPAWIPNVSDVDYMKFYGAYVPTLPVDTSATTGSTLRRVGAHERASLVEGLDMYIAVSRDQTLEFLRALKAAVQSNRRGDSVSLMERAVCAATAEHSDEPSCFESLLLRSSDVRLAIASVFTVAEVEGLIGMLLDHPRAGPRIREKAALRKLATTWGREFVFNVTRMPLYTSGATLLHSATDCNLVGLNEERALGSGRRMSDEAGAAWSRDAERSVSAFSTSSSSSGGNRNGAATLTSQSTRSMQVRTFSQSARAPPSVVLEQPTLASSSGIARGRAYDSESEAAADVHTLESFPSPPATDPISRSSRRAAHA
jgi:hypothetical protein